MGHMVLVWVLRGVVLASFPLAFLATWLHPDLARDVTGLGIPLADGSALVLMRKIGPLHQCPGRHTTRAALRAAVDDNSRKLRSFEEWFRILGINPSDRPRKRGLELIQGNGGDTDPGRRAGLRRLAGHLGVVAALARDAEPVPGELDHSPAHVRREVQVLDCLKPRVVVVVPVVTAAG